MWVLGSAVLMASLLGSTHCVGMCGPLALWASGAGELSKQRVALNAAFYHGGRLFSYLVMGYVAGSLGELVDLGGQSAGYRLLAARIVGGMMILFGLLRLAALVPVKKAEVVQPKTDGKPSLAIRALVRVRPYVFILPVTARAAITGLLTSFLPCGWLYLFAFVAAGTASPIGGVIVMSAFWVGTVPLLVGLVASANLLRTRVKWLIPSVTSLLLVVTGMYTAHGNGLARLGDLSQFKDAAEEQAVGDLLSTELPCCRNSETLGEQP